MDTIPLVLVLASKTLHTTLTSWLKSNFSAQSLLEKLLIGDSRVEGSYVAWAQTQHSAKFVQYLHSKASGGKNCYSPPKITAFFFFLEASFACFSSINIQTQIQLQIAAALNMSANEHLRLLLLEIALRGFFYFYLGPHLCLMTGKFFDSVTWKRHPKGSSKARGGFLKDIICCPRVVDFSKDGEGFGVVLVRSSLLGQADSSMEGASKP